MRRPCQVALVLALGLVARAVSAQPSEADRRNAQTLFDRGRALLEEGRFAEACPLLQESQQLDPGGGTLLNLALCREKEGRLATAHALYNDALSVAIRDGRDERKRLAEEAIAALQPRLPRVQLLLPANVEASALAVTVDGGALPQVAWTLALPLDPGVHEARISAAGFRSSTTRFTAEEGRAITVQLPELQREDGARPPASGAPRSDRPVPPGETRFATASWIVGGAGVVALGASAVTGALALDANASAQESAERAGCMPERSYCRDAAQLDGARADRDRARTLAWVSTGALVVGAVSLATAFFLPREHVTATVGPGHAFLMLEGRLPDLR
jgi:tetratricopeptide (TPR) repeat protein